MCTAPQTTIANNDKLAYTHLVITFVVTCEIAAETKVAYLGPLIVDEQNVSSSYVTMYNVLTLQICHTYGNLLHQLYNGLHLRISDGLQQISPEFSYI